MTGDLAGKSTQGNAMTLTITQATPNDIPDVTRMIRALCVFHGDPCPLGLAEAQAVLIGGSRIALVAHRAGRRIGYAVMEPRWKPMRGGWAYDITQLFVVETERGKGTGRALIEASRDTARQRGAVGLTIGTAPDNPGAAAAYRAMGLTERTGPPGMRFDIAL